MLNVSFIYIKKLLSKSTLSISDKWSLPYVINHMYLFCVTSVCQIPWFRCVDIAPLGEEKKNADVTVSKLLMCSGKYGKYRWISAGEEWDLLVLMWWWWMDHIRRRRAHWPLAFISSLLGSSFPRNPLTYQKGGFLEILFLGVGLISNSMYSIPVFIYILYILYSCVVCNNVLGFYWITFDEFSV